MSDNDIRQDAELDQLKSAARDNKITDRLQWAVIAVVGIGILLYVNVSLLGLINSQANTIRYMQEKCK